MSFESRRPASSASVQTAHTRILQRLLRAGESHLSGEAISAELGISRAAVHKHIVRLRKSGYRIDSQSSRGYRLAGSPLTLDADAIRVHTAARVIGSRIMVYNRIDSTNRAAVDLGRLNGADGAAIFAEEQTSGRGRLGRKWSSPRSRGVYLSILLRPDCDIDSCAPITLMASVVIAEALRAFVPGVPIRIKWPNDLMVGEKKLGGILTEISGEPDRVSAVVLGIGINANGVAKTIDPRATTLEEVGGRPLDRNHLAGILLTALDKGYAQFKKRGFSPFACRWNALSCVNGKAVQITTVSQTLKGIAQGVNAEGSLGLKDASDHLHWIRSGDVHLCR